MKVILVLLFFFYVSFTLAQAPGNVSAGMRWWLKANYGTYTDNGVTAATNSQAVQQWNDRSAIANNARQLTAANKPIYSTNRINGNPTLLFSGDQFITALNLPGIASNQSFNMFLVFKQNSFISGNVNDGFGTFIVDRTPETNNLMSFKMINTNKYNYQKRNDTGGNLEGPESVTIAPTGVFSMIDYYRIVNNSYGIYIDGRLDVSTTANNTDAIAGPTIQLGRHAVNANQGLNGEIAEVILYNSTLTTAERRRIESYLAIKYGMSIDQTTLTDYVNSAGTSIFPVSSNASFNAYRFDIAGIGRDNNSELNQVASQSQNTNSVVSVSNPSSLGNGDFLLWGSNNGSLTTPNSVDVDGTAIIRRLSRVWRLAETNNVGTVTISFDLSAVPGNKVEANLRLLTDRDGDGFADNDRAPLPGTLVGNIFTVTGVNFQSGDYFTIGSTNTSTTPLPIELMEFDVTTEGTSVVATWKTAMEIDNDYFTLEHSINGKNWEIVGTLKGKGNSNTVQSYYMVDAHPYHGRSYYRLKQTDYDGVFTYSSLKSILVEGKANPSLMVYPNPNNGETIHFSNNGEPLDITLIEVYNEMSRKVSIDAPSKSEFIVEKYTMQLSQKLTPGFYMVLIHHKGLITTIKLIVTP